MGFWNKLGKIALQAAPYVAAPFTGGASLMATGATQKLGQKWAESDAKKAIAKGLAPSKFDKYLGMASMGAGLASSMGMGGAITGLSKAGAAANAARAASTAGKVSSGLSGWQSNLGKIGQGASIAMGAAPRGQGTNAVDPSLAERSMGNGLNGWQGQLAGLAGSMLSQSGESETARGEEPRSETLPSRSTAAPRGGSSIADRLNAGRNQAIINQPFRTGYQTTVQGDDDTTLTQNMPPIYTNYNRDTNQMVTSPPISESAPTPIANRFGDEMTPRRTARKRYPDQEVVE